MTMMLFSKDSFALCVHSIKNLGILLFFLYNYFRDVECSVFYWENKIKVTFGETVFCRLCVCLQKDVSLE